MNTSDAISKLRQVLRRQHKALSTEKCDAFWLRRYIDALRKMPPELSSEQKLERFLTDLACGQNVSASTQNQAFNAIVFFIEKSSGNRYASLNNPCFWPFTWKAIAR